MWSVMDGEIIIIYRFDSRPNVRRSIQHRDRVIDMAIRTQYLLFSIGSRARDAGDSDVRDRST